MVTSSPVCLCASRVNNKIDGYNQCFLDGHNHKTDLGISSVWIGSILSSNSSDGSGNNESVRNANRYWLQRLRLALNGRCHPINAYNQRLKDFSTIGVNI
jgi:hypothetical protein